MKKMLLILFAVMTSFLTANAQENYYTLVKPDCAYISVGPSLLLNNKIGDYDFNQNYIGVNLSIGKYFNKYIGLSADMSINNSTTKDSDSRLFTIGAELNTRLSDYYAPSPVDVELGIGLSYGRFSYVESYIHSEGMDYFVPKVSLYIIFNLSSDKAYQLVVAPSYQYFLHTKDKYYYDDGSKVNGDISLIGIAAKLKINF